MIITIIRRPRREVKGFFIFYVSVWYEFFTKRMKFEVDKAARIW